MYETAIFIAGFCTATFVWWAFFALKGYFELIAPDDGVMVVSEVPHGKMVTLELTKDPEALEHKKRVIFKVLQTTNGLREENTA